MLRKEDWMQRCLDQMKECFRICIRDANNLESAVAKHFPGVGEVCCIHICQNFEKFIET